MAAMRAFIGDQITSRPAVALITDFMSVDMNNWRAH
jgi:hypothetical protein